jgi:hypothetical protein
MVFLVTVEATEVGFAKMCGVEIRYESDFINRTIEVIGGPFHWRFPSIHKIS